MAPLWHINLRQLLTKQIKMGFKSIMTACMAMGLNRDWLGRFIDSEALGELEDLARKHGINVAFEGGEAETFVVDAAIFTRRIRVTEAEPVWKGDSGYLNTVRAELVEKQS